MTEVASQNRRGIRSANVDSKKRGLATALLTILLASSIAAIAWSQVRDEGSTTPVLGSLGGKPLPPGPPKLGGGAVSVERVTLDRMVETAEVIFVGRVEAIGGSEIVSPGRAAGFGLHSSHRTRFSVDEHFRGPKAAKIDVSVLDLPEFAVFEVGKDYLVFAEWRELGTSHRRGLAPSGYYQGVYALRSDNEAANEDNGSVSFDELRARTRTTP